MLAETLETYDEHRPYLFGIAYRMLGSVTDAEDVLQESFLRWHGADREAIESPRAWLSTVVTRLCINHLKSARVQREQYVGPWLPEPVVTDPSDAVRDNGQLAESLSQAFLVLLESLRPTERAVFLLREVFDYDFAEIAGIVGKSEANCRQLLARARQHVADRKPRFESSPLEAEGILNQFLAALDSGDVDSLLAVLSADVSVVTDGGGFTNASRRPIVGPDKVSRFLLGANRKFGLGARAYRFTSINSQPGFIGSLDGQVVQVGVFEIVNRRIRTIRFINNPAKLTHLRVEKGGN
jgi:RNA polymerase sigma-70 factor (ECF subfamily)